MGKKKRALLRYKRFGKLSKKLEMKFSGLLRARLNKINNKVEEALEKVEEVLDKTEEVINSAKEEKVTENPKPKAPRKKRSPAKKTSSTTRKRRTTKTKTDA
tara:strand:- start:1250 stop:1555 length:306 start_codon:yes stop_codon:yes gene_type:complete